jgi:hypothetical protein
MGTALAADDREIILAQRIVQAEILFCARQGNQAMATLKTRTWSKLTVFVCVMGLLLFVPALTLRYWQAWVYLSTFAGASVLITLYLMRNDPGRPSKSWKDRGSFLPDRMPSSATRCTRAEHSTYSAHLLHSARIGGWSRSGRRCRF